jgi:hypothetical protein
MKPTHLLAAAAAALVLGTGIAHVRASSDQVRLLDDPGVLYGTVDRADNKQFRELYANKAAVDAAKAGQPLPSGAVLTMRVFKAKVDDKGVPVKGADGRFQKGDPVFTGVMEKRTGWGGQNPPEIRNGEWEYQAFLPDKTVNTKANLKACYECHKPHEAKEFMFSLDRLKAKN